MVRIAEQIAEDESGILDANGRPYCFDRLFGYHPPAPPLSDEHQSPSRSRASIAARVAGCLQQLAEDDEEVVAAAADPKAARRKGRRVSLSSSTKTADNYRPGIDDPWTSIDFDVNAELTFPVCFRTRVDAGLGIPEVGPIKPTVRQQRLLDATAHLATSKSKTNHAEQLSEREMQQLFPEQKTLQKNDSYLQLRYLDN